MRFSSTLIGGAGLSGALTLAPARAAIAATGNGENTPLNLGNAHHAASHGGGGSGIVRTIIALVIVIGLIYAVARIMKAVKGRDQRATGEGLSHLATLPLGANKSVALVRSGADIVLVGISESGMTHIKTYTEEEAIANGILEPETRAEAAGRAEPSFQGFMESLRQMTVRS